MPQIRRYGPDSEPRISPPDDPPAVRAKPDPDALTSNELEYLIGLVTKRPPGYLDATSLLEKLDNLFLKAVDNE